MRNLSNGFNVCKQNWADCGTKWNLCVGFDKVERRMGVPAYCFTLRGDSSLQVFIVEWEIDNALSVVRLGS